MRPIFFMFLAAIALTGCATKAVIEASKERDVDLQPEAVPLKLLSASVLQEGGDAKARSHLYLCLKRSRQGQPERFVLVRISESYPFADDNHQAYPLRGGVMIPEGGISNLFEGCDNPAGTKLMRQLPIIEAIPSQRVTLPEGAADALVVSPRGESGLGLAYMSAAPIFGGYHAVTLDLTASSLYVEHRESRPYLLLLTR